jgi:Fe-S cluster assembly protein SufB
MSTSVRALVNQPYKYGFVTDIPSESIGKGLNEEVIRQIWAKKGEPDFNYSAPKVQPKKKSLDEVDPVLLETFEKLGIPLSEQKRLANVAVDAIFDSVSVATTFRGKAGQGRRDLLLHVGGTAGVSRAGAQVLGQCGSHCR